LHNADFDFEFKPEVCQWHCQAYLNCDFSPFTICVYTTDTLNLHAIDFTPGCGDTVVFYQAFREIRWQLYQQKLLCKADGTLVETMHSPLGFSVLPPPWKEEEVRKILQEIAEQKIKPLMEMIERKTSNSLDIGILSLYNLVSKAEAKEIEYYGKVTGLIPLLIEILTKNQGGNVSRNILRMMQCFTNLSKTICQILLKYKLQPVLENYIQGKDCRLIRTRREALMTLISINVLIPDLVNWTDLLHQCSSPDPQFNLLVNDLLA
jgi:hypothetical protein